MTRYLVSVAVDAEDKEDAVDIAVGELHSFSEAVTVTEVEFA